DFHKAPFKSRVAPRPGHISFHRWRTFVTWDTATVDLPGTSFVAEDKPIQVDCKRTCFVVTRDMAEFMSYIPSNEVASCPVVDGYFTNGACYFSGVVSSQDLYANRTNQTNAIADIGKHVFQTYLYVDAPCYLGHYQNEYEVWRGD